MMPTDGFRLQNVRMTEAALRIGLALSLKTRLFFVAMRLLLPDV